jgi:hypothetical protein
MAENNHHSDGNPATTCSAPKPPRDQPDDRLAELARLIGQSVPMNDLARDTGRPRLAAGQLAREFNPPAQHGHGAPDDVLQETGEEQYSTPGGRYEPSPRADASRQSRYAWYEHEPQSHPDPADRHVESSGAGYDEYEDQSHDYPEDHAYGEDYEEVPILRPRGRFIFIAAVFGVALLGTAGAFAYRGPFADSIVPWLLSIIKAEGGPNQIIPTNTASQSSVSPQADANNAASSERLVAGEERPADVPPPVSTVPQPVSSGPIFTDPAPAAGPGAASVFPPSPLAQPAPAARVDGFNSPLPAPAPPISSANQAAAPAAPPPTTASPATPRPKKIRTVSIRMDQPNPADSAVGQSQRVPARKPTATKIASTPSAASGGGYAVQVSSQRNEKEVRSSFHALQAKYPKLLGGRKPMVRRTDLGAKGIYYRAMVGPFASAEQANELCSNLKAAGGSCIVQKN